MESRKNKEVSLNEEVISYKYYKKILNPDKTSKAHIIEYYVPKMEIVFNEYEVFKLEKKQQEIFFRFKPKPLTAVKLSIDLVNQIQIVINHSFSKAAFEKLKNSETYQFLFKKSEIKYADDNILWRASYKKIGFWENYSDKGNGAIKEAIINFILKNELPKKIYLDSIITHVNNNLNDIEKHTLVNSLKNTLQIDNNGQLMEKRLQEIREINSSHYGYLNLLYICFLGTSIGGLAGLLTKTDLLTDAAIGFLFALALNCADSVYEKNAMNHVWNEIDKRAKFILEAINIEAKPFAFTI